MKATAILLLIILFINCKQTSGDKQAPGSNETMPADSVSATNTYPQSLQLVLDAHGGLNNWRKQHTLRFQMPKAKGPETHTIDLYSRKDRIAGPAYSLGYNGQDVWLSDPDKSYEGNPAFYHNLMFYFYAMPYVLADDGIQYGETDDLVYEGKHYPGMRISYKSGVGASPKDQYYLYYDPETHTMAWLGYTVTFFKDAPSDDLHWIRYDAWKKVNGLLMPESMTWYNYEDHTLKDARNTVHFEQVSLSEQPMPEGFYEAPPEAEIVPPKG